ncbi:carbonic anhydrase 2-like [Babylonia areolata]|uniref:carbonic anhydrase 2-like n=1 Tax=Babylonia areolata TaxID=304850 RepID=UPI003FD52F32
MISLAASFLMLALVESATAAGGSWGYFGHSMGPDRWAESYPVCGKNMQSPIDIDTTAILYDPALQFFDLSQYDMLCSVSTSLVNAGGYTVKMKYSGEPIAISGGSLPEEYALFQFHFHWGSNNVSGSEHTVDNIAAPLELHLVHHAKSSDIATSVTSPYGLAVLGFLFTVGAHNPNFDGLLSYFQNVTYKDEKVKVPSFQLSKLLPPNKDTMTYYRYLGSLTTPPCYETVIWTVFTQKIQISFDQLEKFRTLQTGDASGNQAMVDNYRPVQPLNARRVRSNDEMYKP